MKKYRSIKVVEAAKIKHIAPTERAFMRTTLTFEDGSALDVPSEVFLRTTPKIGDYLVRYEDGYLSISPPGPFEAGYVLIE